MKAEHPGVVHLVDVVARQHDQVPGTFVLYRVEVLVHRVGGPLIPVFAHALLRRKDFDEFSELFRHDTPAHADVTVERERLVLRRDEDPPQAGVDAVAECEVDDAVGPAEEHCRLRALLRKGIQALTRATCEHDDYGVVDERGHRRRLCEQIRRLCNGGPRRYTGLKSRRLSGLT